MMGSCRWLDVAIAALLLLLLSPASLVVSAPTSGKALFAAAGSPYSPSTSARPIRFAHPSSFCKSYLNERNLAAAASPGWRGGEDHKQQRADDSQQRRQQKQRQRLVPDDAQIDAQLAHACLELLNNGATPPPGNYAAEKMYLSDAVYDSGSSSDLDGATTRRRTLLRQWANAVSSSS